MTSSSQLTIKSQQKQIKTNWLWRRNLAWILNLNLIVCIRSYSGQHFPVFGLNKERCGVFLRIQYKCWEMPTRIQQFSPSQNSRGRVILDCRDSRKTLPHTREYQWYHTCNIKTQWVKFNNSPGTINEAVFFLGQSKLGNIVGDVLSS